MLQLYEGRPGGTSISLPNSSALVQGAAHSKPGGYLADQPPLPPPSLLDGFPEPERIENRKVQYLKSLEEQVRQSVATLTQQHQANLEYLRAKNDQCKRQAIATIDQELLKTEMELDRKHDEQLLALQQAAMRRKFDIAKEAGEMTLQFQSRQTQEKLQYLDYELHRKYFDAAAGRTDTIQAPARLPHPPAVNLGLSQPSPAVGSGTVGALPHPEPATSSGTLFVVIQAGHNLMNRDTGLLGDVSDPYVVVKLGKQEHTTPVINNDLNPIWDHDNKFTLTVGPGDKLLNLEVMNSNVFRADSLGTTSLDFRSLAPDVWHTQRDLLKDGEKGELEYCVHFRASS
eukprot:TRINITY_DN34953_c0_g1_i1.p1 TRINITY_DN34953_c0_g1~~TRINITY_DN34953_c0_g1_i1.p1  ORF type:complete len:354 (+),score=85.72 TRINITY_DN34953_c0_g1_i1:36-1064(+)